MFCHFNKGHEVSTCQTSSWHTGIHITCIFLPQLAIGHEPHGVPHGDIWGNPMGTSPWGSMVANSPCNPMGNFPWGIAWDFSIRAELTLTLSRFFRAFRKVPLKMKCPPL